MAIWSRLKSIAGDREAIQEIASATTLSVPDNANTFIVTGTTAITGMTGTFWPGRQVTLIGTDATGPAFTDTAIASTAVDKIHLSAALTLANGSTVTLQMSNVGAWWEIGRAVNG